MKAWEHISKTLDNADRLEMPTMSTFRLVIADVDLSLQRTSFRLHMQCYTILEERMATHGGMSLLR